MARGQIQAAVEEVVTRFIWPMVVMEVNHLPAAEAVIRPQGMVARESLLLHTHTKRGISNLLILYITRLRAELQNLRRRQHAGARREEIVFIEQFESGELYGLGGLDSLIGVQLLCL